MRIVPSANVALLLLILFLFAGQAGCGNRSNSQGGSPYEDFLPQSAPSETNRVSHSAGFSIVSPHGWKTQTITISAFLKDWVLDQFELEGTEKEKYRPKITIQRLGPQARHQWEEALKPDWPNKERYTITEFQGQPALSQFLPGYGWSKAGRGTNGSYEPWLTQKIVFKSQGEWFSLTFNMRNADHGEPYYTQPLTIVQEYFETLRYKSSGN